MNRVLFCALPLLLCSAAFAQPDPNAPGLGPQRPAAPPPAVLLPDTPANAVRYFFNAVQNGSEMSLALATQGAPVGYFGPDDWSDIFRDNLSLKEVKTWKIDSITVNTQSENDASVTLTFHPDLKPDDPRLRNNDPRTGTVGFQLHREEQGNNLVGAGGKDVWRIVPPSVETVLKKTIYGVDPFQLAAVLALHDPRLLPPILQQKNLMSLKQLSLGVMQFVIDYDETYAFDDAGYPRAVLPYVKSDKFFTILGTQGEKWHFNENLSRKPLAALAEPARTVLFYDGSTPDPDHLNFRSSDRTLIAFADGHCKAISKDEFKDLIWKP